MAEAREVCEYIEGRGTGDGFMRRFDGKTSPGFDPDRDLERIGVANQTTMLSAESLAIAAELRKSVVRRRGEVAADAHFRTFDTICSATQDRQDAVLKLIGEPLDVMIVIGGYNSSNTTHLAAICAERVPTYHIEDALCVDPEGGSIRFRPVGGTAEQVREGWLGPGPLTIGLTAGASTPNNKIGETIERIAATRGLTLPDRPPGPHRCIIGNAQCPTPHSTPPCSAGSRHASRGPPSRSGGPGRSSGRAATS
jgi:4-hydroxy-3-methylbut-2-enyl diphosphate reductase